MKLIALVAVMLGMASMAAALGMPEYEAMRLVPQEVLDRDPLQVMSPPSTHEQYHAAIFPSFILLTRNILFPLI